jgi:inner membrane organizing system protein 1
MAEAPETAAPTATPAPPPPAPAPAPAPATSSPPPPKSGIPPRYDLDAKWDACLDLSIRRVAYSSLAGAFTGLLLFRKEAPPSPIAALSPEIWLRTACLLAVLPMDS